MLFAVLMPFVADGPRVEVLGLSRLRARAAGRAGACWPRARSACSPRSPWPRPPSRTTCCAGLQRLRLPDLLVQIMGFMIRYLDVVTAELGRMIDRDALARLRPAVAAALAGAGPVARRAVHPLLRARRAGAPRDARRGATTGRLPDRSGRWHPSSTSAGWPTPTPTATRRCSASTCTSTRASGSPCSAPTAPARPRWCCTSTASSPPAPAPSTVSGLPVDEGEPPGDPAPGRHRLPGPRRPAVHGHGPRRTWRSARPTSGSRGAELDARVMTALEQVGMAEYADRPPHHLSFGQRRRVAVATVLAMEPEILVLDEPSSNLDPASRRELADILRSLDVTVLMVTHDLPYALELCPRSVVLSDGQRGGRRGDVRRAHRRRPDARPPAGAAVRVRSAAIGRTRAPIGSLPAVSQERPDVVPRARDRGDPRAARRAPSTSCSTARSPKTIVSREVAADEGATSSTRRPAQPRTDNILKVAGGVVGVVALFVVIRKVDVAEPARASRVAE